MKKWAICFLVVLLLFSTPVYGNSRMITFNDLETHWIKDYKEILYLLQHLNILNGYPDNTFKPEREITREEFVKVLVEASGEGLLESQGEFHRQSFKDVPTSRWSFTYIETAIQWGILKRDDYGPHFEPEKPITRQEMAIMIIRALQLPIEEQKNTISVFLDEEEISVWAKPYIQLAYDYGIIAGYKEEDGLRFYPDKTSSRGEASLMIYRFLNKKKSLKKIGFYAIQSYGQIQQADVFHEIGFGWSSLKKLENGKIVFSTDNTGSDYRIPRGYEQALHTIEEKGIERKLMLTETKVDLIYPFLEDKQSQQDAIQEIMKTLKDHGFSGIIIDFENIRDGQKGYKKRYVEFLQDLKMNLESDQYTLTVALQPNNVLGYYDGYDYKGISQIADEIILMAHDYHEPRNVHILTDHAPFHKVHEALVNLLQEGVEREKIILGLQVAAATQWLTIKTEDHQSTQFYTPSMTTVYDALQQREGQKGFDYFTMTPYFHYRISSNENILEGMIRYENQKSIQCKIILAKYYGIKGISIWRMGEIQGDIIELLTAEE